MLIAILYNLSKNKLFSKINFKNINKLLFIIIYQIIDLVAIYNYRH